MTLPSATLLVQSALSGVFIGSLYGLLGIAVQALLARFSLSPLNSLLATFGMTAIVEAGIQGYWTADFRRLESVYAGEKLRIGGLFVPVPELITLVMSVALSFGI